MTSPAGDTGPVLRAEADAIREAVEALVPTLEQLARRSRRLMGRSEAWRSEVLSTLGERASTIPAVDSLHSAFDEVDGTGALNAMWLTVEALADAANANEGVVEA